SSTKQGKAIVHIVQHLSPGGLETLVLEMLRFANENDSVHIISLEGTKSFALKQWHKLEHFNDRITFLDKQSGISFKTLAKLYRRLRSLNPDVIHTHHIGPLLYGGIAARLIGSKFLIHTEHDAWHLNRPKAARLQSFLLKLLQPKVVADADFVASQVIHKLGYHRVSTIHNGIDCEKFVLGNKVISRKNFALPQDKFIIGTAGRLEVVKGHELLIKALAHLPEKVHLAIAGDGNQRSKLLKLTSTLGLDNRISFLGLVKDMPQFYQSLDLFCLPSLQEGFPLSTLEAQACGIPCVASDVGAVKETLCPVSGSLVAPNQIRLLVNALTFALNRKPYSPRSYILDHFDIRNMLLHYASLTQEAPYE
ncbi:glycosyltransferase, partial [Vibrio azureus]